MPPKYEDNNKQDAKEFAQFVDLIKRRNVSSYLEIGSKNGASLWGVSKALPKGARIVSVDLPHLPGNAANLRECIEALKRREFDVHLIVADSTDPATVDKVRKLGPFDLIFIDGNHLEPFVRKDWANYGPMSPIIVFHDISWKMEPHNYEKRKLLPIHVPIVWKELKQQYEHLEFRNLPADAGIGVLFRDKPLVTP